MNADAWRFSGQVTRSGATSRTGARSLEIYSEDDVPLRGPRFPIEIMQTGKPRERVPEVFLSQVPTVAFRRDGEVPLAKRILVYCGKSFREVCALRSIL